MREGSVFEDFLYLLKSRDERAVLIKAIIFSVLNKKERNGEKLDELRERLIKKTLEERLDVVIYNLVDRRELKFTPAKLDDGRLYYRVQSKDAFEYELYVAPDDLIHYELRVSTGWAEKPRQEYLGLELSKKTDAMAFFEDLKFLRGNGVNFEDVGKILDRKYRSLTLYRYKIRTHHLEGVLSAQPGALPDTDNDKKEFVDYCTSLVLSQTKRDDGQNKVKAVLTINTKWNFIKK